MRALIGHEYLLHRHPIHTHTHTHTPRLLFGASLSSYILAYLHKATFPSIDSIAKTFDVKYYISAHAARDKTCSQAIQGKNQGDK